VPEPLGPRSLFGRLERRLRRRRLVWGSSDRTGYAVDNCVSRSVRDSAMLFALSQDRSPTAPFRPAPFVTSPGEHRLRVGVDLRNVYGQSPHADVERAIMETATLCEGLGHSVFEVNGPASEEFIDHFFGLFAGRTLGLLKLAEQKAGRPVAETGMLDRFTREFAETGRTLPADAVQKATEYMTQLGQDYADWFGSMDVLLTPVNTAPPPELGYLYDPARNFEEMSRRVFEFTSYTPVQNALGLPGMSVPLGMSGTGLPIGSHFVAAAGREDLLLALAYELEKAKPWAGSWPPTSAMQL
jgi:amidase